MNRIITVSRQFGSGGRTIAKETAKRLDIPCYDEELIDKVVHDSGFTKEYVKLHGENASTGFLSNMFGSSFNKDIIWTSQCKVIRQIAKEGACVIVGRCADYILRNRTDVFKVYVHADLKTRAERIVELYGERSDSPEKRVKDKDRQRASYYRYYTDRRWGIADNYDITLDSGKIGIDRCVEIIVSLY